MKLLICTQAVDQNDSNLGFFCAWIAEFAKHCEQVVVICLREGENNLPQNVRVYSLGKPYFAKASQGRERLILRVKYIVRFLRLIYRLRNQHDAVFVHMNPEYIVLGGFLWRRWDKRIGLWYAHKSITWQLRRALPLVDRVFAVSDTSFPLASPKVLVVGHGIDTGLFVPAMHEESAHLRIVTTGRIARSKRLLEMLVMLDELARRGEQFIFTIVGAPMTATEEEYAREFARVLAERPYREQVVLAGAVAHAQLPAILRAQDMFLNFGMTGNMDKAGLEALAMGLPTLSINPAFEPLLAPWGLYVASGRPADIAEALLRFMSRPDRPAATATLRNTVVVEHSLGRLVPKILAQLQ